jgi:hypothetical protein|tara:strand:+ start:1589 stop:1768 length:180 start_codon:yes stop_codon:yes gene_type:complete
MIDTDKYEGHTPPCRFCGDDGGNLVLSTINADCYCEACGEWQDAILNSAWYIVGYEVKE